MPRTQRSLLEEGLGLLIPGVVISTVAYFFLAGVCDFGLGKESAAQRAAAAPLMQRGAPAPYGATAGVEMAGGRRTGAV
jgi:hypothetical protein